MKIRILALLTVLALLLTACGGQTGTAPEKEDETQGAVNTPTTEPDAPAQTMGAVKLTEKGKIAADSFSMYNTDFLLLYSDDGVQLVDPDGKVQGKTYADVNSLIGNGLVVVSGEPKDNAPQLGVANAYTGEELAPCEAVHALMLNDRYMLLSYKTGVCESNDGAFGLYGEAETYKSVYFTGYGKVLDLQKGDFVPNVEVTTSMFDVSAVGDTILVEEDYSNCVAYDSEGNKLGTYEYMNPMPQSGLILQGLNDKMPVYDSDLNLLSELEGSVYNYDTIDGVDDMLIYTDSDGSEVVNRIIDLKGKALSKDFVHITNVFDGQYIMNYITKDSEYLYGISDFDGNEIIPYEYDSIVYAEPGYFCVRNDDGYFMFDTQGNKLNEDPMDGTLSSLCLYAGSYDQLLVLSTGETIQAESYPSALTLSLVYVDDAVYDLISGEKLFENVDDCFASADSIYVREEDSEDYVRYVVQFA